MIDKITEFFKRDENFSERLKDSRNPFLGTLTLVWIIRNWQIIYAIFFDNREFLVRLNFIRSMIWATTFWEILLQFTINVGLALLAIVIVYSLVYFTRFITNKFENRLLPWLYEKSAPKRVILIKEYEKLEKDIKSLESRLEKEREKRINAEAEVQRLEDIEIENRNKSIDRMAIQSSIDQDIPAETNYSDLLKLHNLDDIRRVFDDVLNGTAILKNYPGKQVLRDLV